MLPRDAHKAYAYLFGLYLGDGDITRHARDVFRLRITLDMRYPGIVESARRAMCLVVPHNRVGVQARTDSGVMLVMAYSKSWPTLLPQHGPGPKHRRPITLQGWQRLITRRFPQAFVRGLIHSDGCRFLARQKVGERVYAYPRYNFSNVSLDIRHLFSEHLDLLGIGYTHVPPVQIQVAQRVSVQALDTFIGPKR
jgi:hypothetical protein